MRIDRWFGFIVEWLGLDDMMDLADDLQHRSGSLAFKSASLYIGVLNYLRDFPHPKTQLMADSLWEIVYHNLVFVALGQPEEPMRVVVYSVDDVFEQAVIRVPEDWLNRFVDDPVFHLGGVLYTGSQAVDFYNGCLTADPSSASLRAQAHEAELVKVSLHEFPAYQIDSYQDHLLRKFPQGLNEPDAKALLYPLAPVTAIEA